MTLVYHVKREKENNIYYLTPGGSQEENETEKETLTRELQEEIAFHIKNAKWIFSFSTIGYSHSFYKVDGYQDGEAKGVEYTDEWKNKNGKFNPVWIDINEVKNMTTFPPFLTAIIDIAENNK